MELKYVIQTVIEIVIAAVLIYGFFIEDKWIAFEQKLFKGIKRFLIRLSRLNTPLEKKAEIIPFERYEIRNHCR